jgi:hypothetical protein
MQVDSEQHFRLAEQSNLCDVPLVSPHWPFIGCCQMAASYGFALSITRHYSNNALAVMSSDKEKKQEVWKMRENISNMGFAEASLGNLTQVWKVSGTYRQTVHRCRLALEQSINDTMTVSTR